MGFFCLRSDLGFWGNRLRSKDYNFPSQPWLTALVCQQAAIARAVSIPPTFSKHLSKFSSDLAPTLPY
tara:strand:- start:167 stop:370 length:204 start_codon:yes stop_codon:yes gene_type:complete